MREIVLAVFFIALLLTVAKISSDQSGRAHERETAPKPCQEEAEMRFKTGDEGQRYEVRFLGDDGKEYTAGWTDDSGGRPFVEVVTKHPTWHSPTVIDRRP